MKIALPFPAIITLGLPLLFIVSMGMPYSASSQTTNNWQLVWSDEFDYEGLPDSTKWSYEQGYIRNDEKQYYTSRRWENARVEDGHLIIESRKDNYQDHDYTAASLTTKHKASWTYGRIVIRAKIPTGRGISSSILLLPVNGPQSRCANCSEIQIMENVGHDPNIIYTGIRTEEYNHHTGKPRENGMQVHRPYSKFGTFILEWTPEHITSYLGDEAYFSFSKKSDLPKEWPFDQEFYLMINTVIGGNWVDLKGIDDSIFPQRLLIDFVRVYKKVK